MTIEEYNLKAVCYVCNLGEKGFNYVKNLSLGKWNNTCGEDLAIANSLLDIFLCFDTREFTDWDGTYSNITEEELTELMDKLDKLLL